MYMNLSIIYRNDNKSSLEFSPQCHIKQIIDILSQLLAVT